MIIVLFHVLYLFGKYIYENLSGNKEKTEDNVATNQLLNVTEADYRDCPLPDYDSKNVKIKFFPPVYVQRYTTVQHVLASGHYQGKIRKVIDFGCAELSFAIHLKNTEGVQEIICVDVDRAVLESFQSRVAPLHCDYLSLRTEPLKIHVCEGSIAHSDNKLANSDAVTCIELIEHLYPNDLDAFPYNVFGFIKPQVAIVTTPNADFNVLFKDMKGFRHPDHKFEWTRKQFQDWATNITLRYPDYEVSFHGIGAGPPGTEQLGSCSQMAVFHRHTQLHDEQIEGVDGLLKTVVFHDYPYKIDNRSDEEKILDEAVYYIQLFSSRDEELMEEIPLEKLMGSVEKFHISVEILRSILAEANWAIADREQGPVVLVPPLSTFSDHSDLNFDNFLEADYRHHSDDNWDNLEPGASGHFYDSYMDRDTQGYEEEENWDAETHDNHRSSNSNLDNVQSAELHTSDNFGHTSNSQWTMEDSNNEDPLLDVSQNQPNVTLNDSTLETELPSNSFSIRLDGIDVDSLNTSSNTTDSLEHHLSSPLPLSDLSEVSRFLSSADSHLLSENQSLSLPNNDFEESARSDASNADTCVESREDLEFDDPVPNPSQPRESNFENSTLQAEINLSVDQSNRLTVENPSSLCPKSKTIDGINCRSLNNTTSSVSTEEATLLLSREQSLLLNNEKNVSPDNQRLLETIEQLSSDCREGLKESVDSIAQNSNASVLIDQLVLEGDNYSDICSIYLQPSYLSNNFLDTNNEVSLNITDLSAKNEICTCLDVTSENGDPSNHKYEEKTGSEEAKSQDSMSFKSISDCSLDLQPKYTSSPQISTDVFNGQGETDNRAERFLQEPNLHNLYRRVAVPQHIPQRFQSLIVEGKNAGNTYQSKKKTEMKNEFDCHSLDPEMNLLSQNDNLFENKTTVNYEIALQNEKFVEDDKISEKNSIINLTESRIVDNISPSTSNLSLHSNISSCTVTSTRSSNVDKWYVAEANPMYQQDIVVLKGGNDAADNANDETTSDSDVIASGSDKDKNSEIINVITQRENAARSNCEATGNRSQDNTNKDTKDEVDQVMRSTDSHAQNIRMEHNLTDLSSCFKNKSGNVDQSFATRVEEILENVFDDTCDKIVPPITTNDSIVKQDLKCNIYEVTQTLTESTKKISEKVGETKSELEFTLETTKRMIEISPFASGKTELNSLGTEIQVIQNPVIQDMDIDKFVPEHLSDLRKIEPPKPIDNKEFPTIDILGINIGEQSQLKPTLVTNFKSTPSTEVSTSYNVNKIGKETRSNLKCEFEPTRALESIESKTFSPESLDASPNSWSPEIMDSGYPNSVSVHDITPEYELSSIANDRISDSDSASVGEEPAPVFYEFIEVENGDLANNNRDDEGNNVIAFEANDLDDLQPLIDVLENDMENENDIYVLQNGFPLWLLRILEMANPIDLEGLGGRHAQLYPAPLQQAGGDAPNLNAENDEGFDSSSSEDESDIEDDEADDATTVSSDETEDHSTENLRGDWRAGGDP